MANRYRGGGGVSLKPENSLKRAEELIGVRGVHGRRSLACARACVQCGLCVKQLNWRVAGEGWTRDPPLPWGHGDD